MGEDGNYRIVMALSHGTNRLTQTDDPRYLRVVREGFPGLTEASRDTVFRKRETPRNGQSDGSAPGPPNARGP